MAENAAEMVKAFNLSDIRDSETSLSDADFVVDIEELDECDIEFTEGHIWSTDLELDDEANEAKIVTEHLTQWSGCNLERLGCVAHALQLVIKECIKHNNVV